MSIISPNVYLGESYNPSFLFGQPELLRSDVPDLDYADASGFPDKPKVAKLFENVPLIILSAIIFIVVITWYNVLSH